MHLRICRVINGTDPGDGFNPFFNRQCGGPNIRDVVSRWELCVFNSACRSKYEKLGRDWSYKDCRPIKQNDIDRFKAAALMSGFDADKLVISGLIAVGGPFDKI